MRYEIEFEVPFVVAKGRPRFTRSGRAYTPAKTRRAEELIANAYKGASLRKYREIIGAPQGVPVAVLVDVYKKPPKAWPKNVPERFKPSLPFVQREDGDNILKGIDSLNGIAWHDDSQVTDSHVIKHDRVKGTETRTEFTISWEIPDEEDV